MSFSRKSWCRYRNSAGSIVSGGESATAGGGLKVTACNVCYNRAGEGGAVQGKMPMKMRVSCWWRCNSKLEMGPRVQLWVMVSM